MNGFSSSDGFTAANWSAPAESDQFPTSEQPTGFTATGYENSGREALCSSRGYAPVLAGHLGLGDDYLARPLAELCPNTPKKLRPNYSGTQYKGRGRPRKTGIVEDNVSRPQKVRRTRILIEREHSDTSQAEIPNLLRATKLTSPNALIGDFGDFPDPLTSCGQRGPGKAVQPHFFYGSSPPGLSKDSVFHRYSYPYGIGLDDSALLQKPESEAPHDSFDDESLFDELIDTEGGNFAVPETHIPQASEQVLSFNSPDLGAKNDQSAYTDRDINPDLSDRDSFGSIEDSLFDNIYEEQFLPTICSPPYKSSNIQGEISPTQPPKNRQIFNSLKKSYSDADDDWRDLDDDTLSGMIPSLDHAVGDVVSKQPYEDPGNIISGPSCADTAFHSTPPLSSVSVSPSQLNSVIVRTPFPKPARDRSPILGLSSETRLRTCFRIGEALNAGCHAARCGMDIVLELYVRVIESHRIEDKNNSGATHASKQYFKFADLFHDHGPFIDGIYEGWKGVELFEADSAAFLNIVDGDDGIKCRVLGRMQRARKAKGQGAGKGWELSILSIWEADWEDVKWVEGIVCA